MKKIIEQRRMHRELQHLEEHLDSVNGALKRKDIAEAEYHIDMAMGIVLAAKKQQHESVRNTDNRGR